MGKVSRWIKELPTGVYTMNELKRISKNSGGTSILHQMLKHGATAFKRQSTHNLWEYHFTWPGYQQERKN